MVKKTKNAFPARYIENLHCHLSPSQALIHTILTEHNIP